MNEQITTTYFAHDALKREREAARRKLENEWGEKINAANGLLQELVAAEGKRLAKFQEYDILISPQGDVWVVLYVSGKAGQLPTLEVMVIPEYEMQRLQKNGSLGKTVEKFAGEALKGWRKQGTMSKEKISAFWSVNRQGQSKRRAL